MAPVDSDGVETSTNAPALHRRELEIRRRSGQD